MVSSPTDSVKVRAAVRRENGSNTAAVDSSPPGAVELRISVPHEDDGNAAALDSSPPDLVELRTSVPREHGRNVAAAASFPPCDGIDSLPLAATATVHDPLNGQGNFELTSDDYVPPAADRASPGEPAGHAHEPPQARAMDTVAEGKSTDHRIDTVPFVLSAAITPTQWAALPPDLRADIVRKAPLMMQKVRALDEEALILQPRLEDEATQEVIRLATLRQAKERSKLVSLKESTARLGQQLASADRELAVAASDLNMHERAVASAELSGRELESSRRRTRQLWQPCPPRPSSDRARTPATTSRPPRYRDGISPPPSAYVALPVDVLFLDVPLDNFTLHVQQAFTEDVRTNVSLAAQSLLETIEAHPGATLRQLFLSIRTGPTSPELTTAAHVLVGLLRCAHMNDTDAKAQWPHRSILLAAAAASLPQARTPANTSRPPRYRDGISPPPSAYVALPVDVLFLDVPLENFTLHVQQAFAEDVRTNVSLAAQSLLETSEAHPGATLRQLFLNIRTGPTSPELATAAHMLVGLLRCAHMNDTGTAQWPHRSRLLAAAAASSPRARTPATTNRPPRYLDVIPPPPSAYVTLPVDVLFLDVPLENFTFHFQQAFAEDVRTNVSLAAQSLLETIEAHTGATLRQVFLNIATDPTSPEVATAAHVLVGLLRCAHMDDTDAKAQWPHRSRLPAGAAASSPRRQTGSSPCHGRRGNSRQGRSSEVSSSSRHHRAGKKKLQHRAGKKHRGGRQQQQQCPSSENEDGDGDPRHGRRGNSRQGCSSEGSSSPRHHRAGKKKRQHRAMKKNRGGRQRQQQQQQCPSSENEGGDGEGGAE